MFTFWLWGAFKGLSLAHPTIKLINMAMLSATKSNPLKGYKAFKVVRSNLGAVPTYECLGYQYKVGQSYSLNKNVNGKIIKPLRCTRGFHFCTKIRNVLSFYNGEYDNGKHVYDIPRPIVIGRVSAWGLLDYDSVKTAAQCIRIDKLLTLEEVKKLLGHDKIKTATIKFRWEPDFEFDYWRKCQKGAAVAIGNLPFDEYSGLKLKKRDFEGESIIRVKVTYKMSYVTGKTRLERSKAKVLSYEIL